jgi:hypothetical protein
LFDSCLSFALVVPTLHLILFLSSQQADKVNLQLNERIASQLMHHNNKEMKKVLHPYPYPYPYPNLTITLILTVNLTLISYEQRAQDVARQTLVEETAIMESRVKLHTWRVGIKQRALQRELLHEQVWLYVLALAPPLSFTLRRP